MKEFGISLGIFAASIGLLVGLIYGSIAGIQPLRIYIAEYSVTKEGLVGEAELKRAEQNRQIKIQEAKAKLESAKFLADAEVARAVGVAEANKIIAEGLGGPQGYLRYLYIDKLGENQNHVYYIPTEAGLPILEAGKR